MSEPRHVPFLMEDPAPQYASEVGKAKTLDALLEVVRGWPTFAPDAIAAVEAMDEEAFKQFREGLVLERKKEFAGEGWAERFAVIIIPERLLRTTDLALTMKVPWGVAWQRIKQVYGWH